jgi:hypothetical protein
MNLLLWGLAGVGAWLLLGKKAATTVVAGTGAAPVTSNPIQPVTNQAGADLQVSLALASKDPNQMRLVAAQLRANGYGSQATTLETAALAAQAAGAGASILKDIGL